VGLRKRRRRYCPYTPRAKKVLELSLREALQLGHNYVGTEHLLLALLREREGVGARVLNKLGAELCQGRQEVIELLASYEPRQTPAERVASAKAAYGWALQRLDDAAAALRGAEQARHGAPLAMTLIGGLSGMCSRYH